MFCSKPTHTNLQERFGVFYRTHRASASLTSSIANCCSRRRILRHQVGWIMRMDDSPISVETPTVAPEATTPGTAAVASSLFVSKKAEDSDTTGDPSSVAEVTPPPLPEEKLQGKELIEALKKQVGVLVSPNRLRSWMALGVGLVATHLLPLTKCCESDGLPAYVQCGGIRTGHCDTFPFETPKLLQHYIPNLAVYKAVAIYIHFCLYPCPR